MDFSVQEKKFMRQLLVTRSIPSPKIPIKDNKTTNEKGEFPTRLMFPLTKFTAAFSKLGYLGIKRMLDKAKVNYSHISIFQAYDLEDILEDLKIERDGVTI